ncbi:30S ribosomal protein S17 [Aquicella siphonis]|uniref:Small ribosomal subunit protein uS17 n=2 Tax=Aquicella siphonis TaxID=254247 RepID=A0A5E4PF97_9COXI|nr:30S ribosomal protein S17 [Aquicella siphonis]
MTDEKMVEKEKSSRTITGTVISDKMNKTIVVQVERKVKHPLYGKYIRRFSKMYAHDEDNACHIGDLVVIQQTRPLSKTKRWKLVEILKREEQQ